MRAVYIENFGAPDVLRQTVLPVPEPGPGEVLIKVATAGVLYNDIMVRTGWHPKAPSLPIVPGCEVVGVVKDIGSGVASDIADKRVAANIPCGGYAEWAVAPANMLLALPDDISDHEAPALLVNAPTALVMLEEASIQAGQSVLINAAAGGVGSLLAASCRAMGAKPVIGSSSTAKVNLVSAYTDVAIDYFQSDWSVQVIAASGGSGVDIVFDSVGGDIGTKSLSCLRPGGMMVQYGLASRKPTQVDSFDVISKGLRYVGFGLPHYPKERWFAGSRKALEFKRKGLISLAPGHIYPLTDVAEAHAALERRETTGKIILKVL